MANSRYQQKVRRRADAARVTPSTSAVPFGYTGRRPSVISVDRFAQIIEFGLANRYRAGDVHVTTLRPLPVDVQSRFDENAGAAYEIKVGRQAGDAWNTLDRAVFRTASVPVSFWRNKETVPVEAAIQVATALGIRQLGNAKIWEDMANGNGEFFGWAKRRSGALKALRERISPRGW